MKPHSNKFPDVRRKNDGNSRQKEFYQTTNMYYVLCM